MATLTWVGGGTDNIYAPSDWSPAQTPRTGDALYMYSGTANMAGGNLAGDTLYVGTQTTYSSPAPAVVNLSDNASLTAVAETTAFTQQNVVFNAKGFDTLNLTVDNNYYATMNVTVNIANYSMLRGTIAVGGHNGDLTINGGTLSAFDNDGGSSVGSIGSTIGFNCVATINTIVLGLGSFDVSAEAGLTFMQPVAPGQTVNLAGDDYLDIASPHTFFGLVDVAHWGPSSNVTLQGITNADSYRYANDLLTLFHGNRPIDVLRLANTGPFQVTENASGVSLGAVLSPSALPPGTTVLPQHGFSLGIV